jgi:hypothetical protein
LLRELASDFADLGPDERFSTLRAGLRRKEVDVSFPFPAVETAGYYQSSPAGTEDGIERMGRTP